MRTKVLHCYKSFYPQLGGVETAMKAIVEGLEDQFEFFVLTKKTASSKKTLPFKNLTVIETRSLITILSVPLMPLYFLHFYRLCKRVQVVHHHAPMPLTDLVIFLFLPRHVKLVLHWHANVVRQKKMAWVLNFFFQHSLKRADEIIVSSEKLQSASPLLKNYSQKTSIIPFGVQKPKITPALLTLSQELKKNYGQFFLCVGRLVRYKGFDTAIRAVKDTAINLVIIGEGPEKQNLLKLIKKLNLENQVHLLDGIDDVELKAYYQACHALCLPSRDNSEAFAIVQVEAMSFAKPVINTKLSTGVPWVARHNKEALTVAPNDELALRQAMQKLMSPKNLYDELCQNAKQRAETQFSVQNFLQKTKSTYLLNDSL